MLPMREAGKGDVPRLSRKNPRATGKIIRRRKGEPLPPCGVPDCPFDTGTRMSRVVPHDPATFWCDVHRRRVARNGHPDLVSNEWAFSDLQEEVALLVGLDYTRSQIAEKLGIKWGSISKAYNRAGIPTPAPRLPSPGSH